MTRKPSPSDISDEEWAIVASYLTLMREDAQHRRDHDLREVFNGVRYRMIHRHEKQSTNNRSTRSQPMDEQYNRRLKAAHEPGMMATNGAKATKCRSPWTR